MGKRTKNIMRLANGDVSMCEQVNVWLFSAQTTVTCSFRTFAISLSEIVQAIAQIYQ